jgi:hypothetical protein
MQDVREVLPARLAPQILSVGDDVRLQYSSWVYIITFNGGCPGKVLSSTRDDTGEVPCQRQKWTRWSVLTILLNEKGEADFASDCKYKHLEN